MLPRDAPGVVIGYVANSARDRAADFSQVSDVLRTCSELAEPQTKSFPWSHTYSRDEWLGQLLSHSDHLALAPEVRDSLLDEVRTTIDSFGGTFEMRFRTILISAIRS